jgi:hypothetical protein
MSRVHSARPALRATVLATTLALASWAAQAQVVTNSIVATGSYQLGTGAQQNLVQSRVSGTVDVLAFPYSGPDSAGLHSYGSDTGNFGSRSSGGGVYDVTGSFKIVQTVTNNSGLAQNATFNFYITPGMVSNYIGSSLSGAEFVKAGISFDVQRNTSSVWGSNALLQTTTAGTRFSASGDTSLYVGGGTQYVINGAAKSVDLGVINAGESISLSYELKTFAQGVSFAGVDRIEPAYTYVVPAHWINPCSGGYGYGSCPVFVPEATVLVPEHTVYGAPSTSHANAGDPFSINFNDGSPSFGNNGILPPGTITGVVFAPVPEPGTWGLMLAGLLGVAFVAKRRPAGGA